MKIMKRKLTLAEQRAFAGYMFILPFIAGLLIIFIPSMIKSFIFSLSKQIITSNGYVNQFVGYEQYNSLFFKNPNFNRTFISTITNMFYEVPMIIIFSFFISSLLNQNFKGRGLARVIFFLPVILASGIVMKIENLNAIGTVILHSGGQEGNIANQAIQGFQIQQYLDAIGFSPQIVNYLSAAITRIYTIISNSGVQILIFLAALQTIPNSLYEASSIEGATAWENFWKITFPMLGPYILTNTVYSIIDNFTSYKNQLMVLIINTSSAQKGMNYGLSSAMAWVYFAAIVVILGVTLPLISKKVFYYN